MDAREFQKRADECLAHVSRWLEDFDPDEVDYTTTDGVVTLSFADGARFVLNRQSAVNQMWADGPERTLSMNQPMRPPMTAPR